MFKLLQYSSLAAASSAQQTLVTTGDQQELKTIDKYTPILFLEGLLYGALGTQVQNLATCEADSVFELKDAEKVLEDIAHLEGRQAATDFVQMLAVIPTVVEKCPLIMQDAEIYNTDVITWIKKQLADPKAFTEHILESFLVNRNDIQGKSKDALNQYEKGDWWMVGYDMGSLVSETVVGHAVLPPKVAATMRSMRLASSVPNGESLGMVGLDDSSKVMLHPVKISQIQAVPIQMPAKQQMVELEDASKVSVLPVKVEDTLV